MAYMSCEIEYVRAAADQPAHEVKIAGIALDDFDVVFYRFEVEGVCTACRIEVVEHGDGRTNSYKVYRDVASDEAETAGD